MSAQAAYDVEKIGRDKPTTEARTKKVMINMNGGTA